MSELRSNERASHETSGLNPLQPQVPQPTSMDRNALLYSCASERAPPPAAHTAVPVGHLWNASTGWNGGKVVLSPNCRVSWQPRGFEAPPAHSSGLGPLVPPEFPAETLVKGSRFAHGDPYFPPHVEETTLRDARRHLPMQKSVGPFRVIRARSFSTVLR